MKKAFRTTFEDELIKELKKMAVELNCSVNDILEVSYKYAKSKNKLKELLKEKKEKR